MIEAVPPPNETDSLTLEISKVWLEMGRCDYEIDILQARHADLMVKARNLNQKALKIQKDLEIAAKKEALKVNLGGQNAGQVES